MIKELKGKNIAIVAMGKSQLDYHLSISHSKEYDEVWAINSMCAVIKCDRVFMMDRLHVSLIHLMLDHKPK